MDEEEAFAIQVFLVAIEQKVETLKERQSVAETYDELVTNEARPSSLSIDRDIFEDVDE